MSGAPAAPSASHVTNGARAGALALGLAGACESAPNVSELGFVGALSNTALAMTSGALFGAALGALAWLAIRTTPPTWRARFTGRPHWKFLVSIALGGALSCAVGLGLAHRRYPDLSLVLWDYAWVPAVALVFCAAFLVVRARVSRRLHAEALAILLLLGLAAARAVPVLAADRGAGRSPLALAGSFMQTLTDLDRDGASAWFGGNDCAPFDAAIGPAALEIPQNGIDDNCLSGDLPSTAHGQADPRYAALPSGFPERPNLLLVTIDALRADHLGFFGYPKPTSPRLDRLSARGVVFESAFSQGPGTFESLPSLLTSKYPYRIAVEPADSLPPPLASENRTLAKVLRERGYATAAVFPCHLERASDWGLCAGFDTCDTSLIPARDPRAVTSDRVTKRALQLLDELGRRSERPFLLWVHYYDPHSTYVPHPGFLGAGASNDEERYESEIAFTDHHAGTLLETILDGELARSTVVALTSDHGEGFKTDHGFLRHGYGLGRELLHVPLVFWAPGALAGRRRAPVGNIDVMPTLLNLAGVEERGLQGRALLPSLFQAREDGARRVYSEKTFSGTGAPILKSVTTRSHRLIYNHSTREALLFDRQSDPAERKNLVHERADVFRPLLAELEAWMERETAPYYPHIAHAAELEKLPPNARPLDIELLPEVRLRGLLHDPTPPDPGYLGTFHAELFFELGEAVPDTIDVSIGFRAEAKPEGARWVRLGGGLVPARRSRGRLIRHAVDLAVPPDPKGTRRLWAAAASTGEQRASSRFVSLAEGL